MSTKPYYFAKPYAKAVFNLARETDAFEQWNKQLQSLATLCLQPSLQKYFKNPFFQAKDLEALIRHCFNEPIQTELGNLIKVLIRNQRLGIVFAIQVLYEKMVRQYKNIKYAEVTSAAILSTEEKQALTKKLEHKYACHIDISFKQDPKILGGFLLKLDDLRIDYSLQGMLQNLQTTLTH